MPTSIATAATLILKIEKIVNVHQAPEMSGRFCFPRKQVCQVRRLCLGMGLFHAAEFLLDCHDFT